MEGPSGQTGNAEGERVRVDSGHHGSGCSRENKWDIEEGLRGGLPEVEASRHQLL